MAAPSDAELSEQLRVFLKDADLEQTTARSIRTQLENHFGVALQERKQFISSELEKLINEGQDEEEEAPVKKEKKSAPKRKPVQEAPEPVKRPRVSRSAAPPSERQLQGLGRAAAPKAKRGPLSSTAVKDPNAPKKPGSAYNFFTKEKTAELKEAKPSMSFAELTKGVGRLWQQVTDHEKLRFEALANADKERYEAEMASYVAPTQEQLLAVKEAAKAEKRKNSMFVQPVKVSPQLAEIVGGEIVARNVINAKLNEYINAHGLKDPSNRQWALCDPTLKELTGLDRIKVFGIQTYVKQHITRIDKDGAAADGDEEEEEEEEGADDEEEGARGEGR